MLTRHRSIGALFALIVFLALGVGVSASRLLTAINPEEAKAPALVPPLLAPPGSSGYTPATSVIFAPDGRPVAQLSEAPADLGQRIAVNIPKTAGIEDSSVAYSVLASVRYEGSGQIVLVTTARPSPSAAQQPAVLGSQTIRLTNGITAWATEDMPGEVTNQVVFIEGDLIITVAGNVPTDLLKDLASRVTIKTGG
ncbi:MAG: hypothetical protein M1132_12345 [Chloroflexi bacterium]|nr:hypothetical protein [Chloroflexota bacterium]MCL5952487.1 hypothetical protein [Chloroflexota bacterium]